MHDEIATLLKTVGNLPLEHSFFLSHRQDNAGDLVATLSLKLHHKTDAACWFDQDAEKVNKLGENINKPLVVD